jgi:hypothetical protein
MATLSKAALLGPAAVGLPRKTLHITELDGDVIVQGLTAAQRDEFEGSLVVGKGRKRDVNMKNMRAKLVVLTVIGEDGQRLFTESDIAQLGAMRADILDRIFAVAKELSGLSDQDEEDLTSEKK